MDLSVLIIGGLATWRLSHAIVKENGPLMMFARLRAKLASAQKRSGGLFDMVSCVYCTSFWIALVGALWVATTLSGWFAYALAFSAVACVLEALIAYYSNPFPLITGPAADDEVSVSRSSTSK